MTLNLYQVCRSQTLRICQPVVCAPAAPPAFLNWHAARPLRIPIVTAVSVSSCGEMVTAQMGCARPAPCVGMEAEWLGPVGRWEILYVSGVNQGLTQRRGVTGNPACPAHAVLMMRWRSDPASRTLTPSVWVSHYILVCIYVNCLGCMKQQSTINQDKIENAKSLQFKYIKCFLNTVLIKSIIIYY